jgi:hypothetical protein
MIPIGPSRELVGVCVQTLTFQGEERSLTGSKPRWKPRSCTQLCRVRVGGNTVCI